MRKWLKFLVVTFIAGVSAIRFAHTPSGDNTPDTPLGKGNCHWLLF